VSDRIRRLARRAVREGRSIRADASADALQDLRETCERLRYLADGFVSFHLSEPLRACLASVGALQADLQALEELHVRTEGLRSLSGPLMKGAGSADLVLALGELAGELESERTELGRSFPERFGASGLRRTVRALLRDGV
jgi:CHAD domain-containing protein